MRYFVFIALLSMIAACGVKPDSLSAPSNYEGPAYPQKYPSKNGN